MNTDFDIIVIGGGHAGCEAAAVAARMGARVALVTFDLSTIGAMSCNPAIGGLGKGHLVREVDAFDGLMARAADAAGTHYRMLNRSKGSAVHGPRVQADRRLYKKAIFTMLDNQHGLSLITGEAISLCMSGGRISGLTLADGTVLSSSAVILATGTFLAAEMFRGKERRTGGRVNEQSSSLMAKQLRDMALPMARLKTGTPPRLDGRTVNWSALSVQPSDSDPWMMSPLNPKSRLVPQLPCAITRTNDRTHEIIRKNLHLSPLFTGAITALGPRYCPSLEDKVHRFADRDGHQVFLEPEGLDSPHVYPNGVSTSLPPDVQQRLLRTIAGLESVKIVVAGYAVEYDFIDPRALRPSLEVRAMPGLYFAGQINGTTGYEEAAAQGLIAGLNAASCVLGRELPIIDRSNSYMAVMIDDLTLQGVSEPYRMLTARAEYRLRLRANNASTRLTPIAIQAGCVSKTRKEWFESRNERRDALREAMMRVVAANELAGHGIETHRATGRHTLSEWVKLGVPVKGLRRWIMSGDVNDDDEILDELAEDIHYAPYIARQERELAELRASERTILGDNFPYASISGLSNEMAERLSKALPTTLAAAGRVPGVTPAALAVLLVEAKRRAAAA